MSGSGSSLLSRRTELKDAFPPTLAVARPSRQWPLRGNSCPPPLRHIVGRFLTLPGTAARTARWWPPCAPSRAGLISPLGDEPRPDPLAGAGLQPYLVFALNAFPRRLRTDDALPGEASTRRSSISRCGMPFRLSLPATSPSGTRAHEITNPASSPACCLMATAAG